MTMPVICKEIEVEVEIYPDDMDAHFIAQFVETAGITPSEIYPESEILESVKQARAVDVLHHFIVEEGVSSEVLDKILAQSDYKPAVTPPSTVVQPNRSPDGALADLLHHFGTYEDLLAWLARKMQKDGTGTMAQVILTGSGLGPVADELAEAWDKEFMRRIRLISGK
jgi:hypothetical protein